MKPVLLTIVFLILAISVSAQTTWTGATNTNWNLASNWSPAVIPTSTTDVLIPVIASNRYPVTSHAIGNCRNLTVQNGTWITVSYYNLNVLGTANFYGHLNMNADSQLQITGSVYWRSGSTANIINSSSTIICYSNMTFYSGSNVQLNNGFLYFQGSANSTLYNYSSATVLNRLRPNKNIGATFTVSASSTQDFTVQGDFYNATTSITKIMYAGNITVKGYFYSSNTTSVGFMCDAGTIIMDGVSYNISLQNAGDYFNNLKITPTGSITLQNNLTVKGNLTIESGVFSLGNYNINIGGNWTNMVGTAGFTEGLNNQKVIFNGSGHQYIYSDETFNIVEINKLSGALRINNASRVVTCAKYDWTAGALDILSGTFTINDLVDNGLFGNYYCNSNGVLNITNNDGYIDLNGHMYIYGGYVNIYGGTSLSYWPYSANASITMSGGTLDFKSQGVYLYPSPTYTLSTDITGGTIKVAGSFLCHRSDFNPTGGEIEFVGTNDVNVFMTLGSNFFRVNINKTSRAGEEDQPLQYRNRDGEMINVTRANKVTLTSNLTLSGYMNITAGTLEIGSYILTIEGYLSCHGTISMNNAAARISTLSIVSGSVNFYSGSTASITQGTIECANLWGVYAGANVVLPAAVVIRMTSTSSTTFSNSSLSSQLGSLELVGGGSYQLTGGAPHLFNGYITINAGSTLRQYNDMTVNGNLNLNGALIVDDWDTVVHGKVYTGTSSSMNVDIGGFTCDNSTIPRTTYVYGSFSITGIIGVIEFTNNNISIEPGGELSMNGGQLIADGLTVDTGASFQPTGGVVLITSNPSTAFMPISISAGNYFHQLNLFSNRGIVLNSNLRINQDLIVQTGTIDVSTANYSIDLYGDWTNTWGQPSLIKHQGTVNLLGNTSCVFASAGEQFYRLNLNKTGAAQLNIGASQNLSCDLYDWVSGAITVQGGSFTAASLVDGGIYGTYNLSSGSINISNLADWVDINGNITITGGEFHVHGGASDSYWPWTANGSLTMTDGLLDFHDVGIYFYGNSSYTFSVNISGGLIRCAGGFYGDRGGFDPTGGTVEIYGSADGAIALNSAVNSYFYNLVISKPIPRSDEPIRFDTRTNSVITRNNEVNVTGNTTVTNNLVLNMGTLNLNGMQLTVNGNMTINSAQLKSLNAFSELNVLGNMTWNAGSSDYFDTGNIFLHGDLTFNNGTDVSLGGFMHFEGASNSSIYCNDADASLANLILNKTGPGQYYINAYNTSGNGLRVNSALAAYDANHLRSYDTNILVLDDLGLNPGSELRIASGSPSVIVGGNTVIYDLARITQAAGTNPYFVFWGDLIDQNTVLAADRGFYVSVANLTFAGSTLQDIECPRSELALPNLTIDKAANSFAPHVALSIAGNATLLLGNWTDVVNGLMHKINGNFTISSNASYIPAAGNILCFTGNANSLLSDYSSASYFNTLKLDKISTANTLTLGNEIRLAADGLLHVSQGTFVANGKLIRNQGTTNISNGGKLNLNDGSILETGNDKVVTVNNGGELECLGTAENNVIMRAYSGYWSLQTVSGAFVSATHTVFNKTQGNGVRIVSGASVDPANSFSHCSFQNGKTASSYLTIDNSQDLTIPNAAFLTLLAEGYNITKNNDAGSINLTGASGPFAGPAYENDVYNRVHWAGFSPNLIVTSFNCNNLSPYVGDLVEYTVTIQNDSDNPVLTPFNVHLFKNRASAPGFAETGDAYYTFSSLAAHAITSYTFAGCYSMTPESWTSYALIDPEGAISETDETDNRAVLQYTIWNALPAVQNASLGKMGDDLRLSWSYPIPVSRFRIYWDNTPYGIFSDLLGTSSLQSYTFAPSADFRFYRIVAERDVPTP